MKNGHYKTALERIIGYPDSVTGNEHNYPCPGCHASHLHINYELGRATCHKCGLGAKNLASLARKLGANVTIKPFTPDDVTDYLIDSLFTDRPNEVTGRKGSLSLPESFKPLYPKTTDKMGGIVRRYLRGRGLTTVMMKNMGIGYCTSGKFTGYAIFPVFMDGELVTYTSRRVVGLGAKVEHASGEKSRKAVFNYNNCHGCKRLFICEGPFDALAMHGRLRPSDAGTCLLGTVIHAEKVAAIAAINPKEVIVLLDNDAESKAGAVAEAIMNGVGCRVRIAVPPDARDPDEMTDDELRAMVKSAREYDPLMELLR